MKEVFIKYNPYKLETEFTVDGEKPALNSRIGEKIVQGSRLQEWIEEIPAILLDEYNDNEFNIQFHGTLLDYEDLNYVFAHAADSGELAYSIERIPAQETRDKEVLIDEVFDEIQENPYFDELKDPAIISSFENAKSSDFEVCVVATMSAGKSTLINSMLEDKLMPSKGEACTAIITRIKDTDGSTGWRAEVYDKEGELVETHEDISLDVMERLNGDNKISRINIAGDIPFLTAEDVSLVLIDTPGPNNSRDPEHRRVQSQFLNRSSKSLVLYIMEATFGSDDDNALLHRVAESMAVGGKQSKDRFIFVVNKMDGRRKEDGSTEETLDKIRAYLKQHGIENPNLFPVAALPALNIRLMEKYKDSLDEDTIDETEFLTGKLNKRDELHLERFASLPASVSGRINQRLAEAEENEDAGASALIHTGIPSVEAAIRQYVQKYAKTAKIKNIVDTFKHKLDEVNCFEKTKNELAANRKDGEAIAAKIAEVRKKIDDGNAAKNFKQDIDKALVKVGNKARDIVEGVIGRYQKEHAKKIDNMRGSKIDLANVDHEVEQLKKFAEKLEPDFHAELDDLIRENSEKTRNELVKEYKSRLASLSEDVDLSALANTAFNPIKFVSGNLAAMSGSSFQQLTRSERVSDGYEWVRNENKHWWNPFTWFSPSEIKKEKFKTVEFISGEDLAEAFFTSVDLELHKNGEASLEEAKKQANEIAAKYIEEFEKLDWILKDKLAKLESYAADDAKAQERIRETEMRLDWLEDILNKVDSILDI